MANDRISRVNELLKREIGSSLFQIMSGQDFDLSAATVTGVVTSRDLRSAQVRVSIRGEENEQKRMLSMLKRHRSDIQRHIAKVVVLKYTPKLSFVLDTSLQKGDAILGLLLQMEQPPLEDLLHEESHEQAEPEQAEPEQAEHEQTEVEQTEVEPIPDQHRPSSTHEPL